jgi:hypothetical protein
VLLRRWTPWHPEVASCHRSSQQSQQWRPWSRGIHPAVDGAILSPVVARAAPTVAGVALLTTARTALPTVDGETLPTVDGDGALPGGGQRLGRALGSQGWRPEQIHGVKASRRWRSANLHREIEIGFTASNCGSGSSVQRAGLSVWVSAARVFFFAKVRGLMQGAAGRFYVK